MSEQDFEVLRKFLEEKPAAIRAAGPLKDGTSFAIRIEGDPDAYHALREGKKTLLRQGAPPKEPVVSFSISPKAIERLANFPSEDIGEYGVEFFRLMVSKDPEIKLGAKLHVGFLGLTRIGVFGVLAQGGAGVMAFLARQGLASLKDVRKAIAKLRGSDE
ncbi:MAG: hypothetical protein C4523_16900 [Myxococcales bacterium]|nr:MAG: hypothetical protein C4523_16900 [Myxococcales bacterium]